MAEEVHGRPIEIGPPKGWAGWKQNFRLLYLRLMHLKGKPEEVAGGVAIGVFIGMTPTIPFHTVLAVFLAFFLRRSKLAAAIGVWISNPLIVPLVYLLDYKVGKVITRIQAPPFHFSDFSLSSLIKLGWNITFPMLIGGVVTGALLAIPAYFLTKRIIILYREKHRIRSDRVDSASDPT